MDLESELREAMAERAAHASAPATLAADVRRRHKRRVNRIRVSVGVAATAVAVAAVAPTYSSIRAEPLGSRESTRPTEGTDGTGRSPARPVPSPTAASPSPSASAGEPTAKPTGKRPGRTDRGSGGPRVGPVKIPDWVGYLPSGVRAGDPCSTEERAARKVTTCRWTGSGGWVEIEVVRGGALAGPEDLFKAPAVPAPASVRGIRALRVERSDGTRIGWVARPGVGVVVAAGGGPVREKLMRIAEEVRP